LDRQETGTIRSAYRQKKRVLIRTRTHRGNPSSEPLNSRSPPAGGSFRCFVTAVSASRTQQGSTLATERYGVTQSAGRAFSVFPTVDDLHVCKQQLCSRPSGQVATRGALPSSVFAEVGCRTCTCARGTPERGRVRQPCRRVFPVIYRLLVCP